MANQFIYSPDDLATADLAQDFTVIGSPTIGANAPDGRNTIRVSNWSAGVRRVVPDAAEYIVGFRFRMPTAFPGSEARLMSWFESGGVEHTRLYVTPAGVFSARRLAVNLGDGSVTAVVGVEHHVECRFKINDTTGTVDIVLDGTNILSLTGQDTRNGGTGLIGLIEFFTETAAAQTADIWDIYINDVSGGVDDGFWGSTYMFSRTSDGEGDTQDWTPSTGTDNSANVDDSPPDGDSTYNSSSTVNHKDLLTTEALGYTGTIKGISLEVYARRVEAAAGAGGPMG
jgi:hypothetical protein